MTDEEYEAFMAFSTELTIDPNQLDTELIRMPQLQFEVSTYCANARQARDDAKHAYESIIAGISVDIRQEYVQAGNKLPGVDYVRAEAVLVPEAVAAQQVWSGADYDYTSWTGLFDAIKTKGYSINNISELMKAGYMSRDTIYDDTRETIRQARVNARDGG